MTVPVRSRLGAGLRRLGDPSPSAATTDAGPGDPAPTILVVDDEDLVRRYTSRVLVHAGFGVVQVDNGGDALSLLIDEPDGFALVVSDVVMPWLDGPELAAHAVRVAPKVPFLFMTNAAGASPQRLPRGAAVLPKPFSAPALIARVRDLIRRGEALADPPAPPRRPSEAAAG